MNAVDAQEYWEANDRDGYVSTQMANDTTAAEKKPTKAMASRWFNLLTVFADLVGCQHDRGGAIGKQRARDNPI